MGAGTSTPSITALGTSVHEGGLGPSSDGRKPPTPHGKLHAAASTSVPASAGGAQSPASVSEQHVRGSGKDSASHAQGAKGAVWLSAHDVFPRGPDRQHTLGCA